jgi:hypothetical protein
VAPATNTLTINTFIEGYLHWIRQDSCPLCDTVSTRHEKAETRSGSHPVSGTFGLD